MATAWSSPVAFDLLKLDLPDWFYTALTWGVVVFELVGGFTLYFRKTRLATVIVGTLFHVSVAIILLIPWFLNCVTMYALFFEYKKADRARPADTS
jgi:hypothetical protein